jgi:4-amino-4-deoxy-L-arabinose transferase-like glycosyltransferase
VLGDRRDSLRSRLAPLGRRPLLTGALIVVAALALRVAVVAHEPYTPVNDARSYLILGSQVARLGDYGPRDGGAAGTIGPTAYFAPGYPYLLAALDRATGRLGDPLADAQAARYLQAGIGTLLVVTIGLLAEELLGTELGLVALALAAIDPALIELSSVIVVETLFTLLEVAAMVVLLRARRAREPSRLAILAGVLGGLTALTHPDGLAVLLGLMIGAAGLPCVLGRRPVAAPALILIAGLVTIAPWIVRNAVELHSFVPISDESGVTLAGTYNPTSAHATDPPWKWIFFESIPADRQIAREAPRLTETALDSKLEGRALRYIARHPAAPLEVAGDNTLRLLELEGSRAWKASAASVGLPIALARIGVYGFWILGVLALIGLLSPWRRLVPGWMWATFGMLWLISVLVNAETPRFRQPLEPLILVLAACGLAAIAGARPRLGRKAQRDRLTGRSASPA